MAENDVNKTTYELIAIGGSAGSLQVIIEILQHLWKKNFAIVIVMHRKETPEPMLADLLASKSIYKVKEVEEKESILPGVIYLASPNYHLLVEKDYSFSLDASEKVNFSRPSIDVFLESASSIYGKKLIGILLSGGNNDGAAGIQKVRENGGLTIVQDPSTADVPSMPEAAMKFFRPDYISLPEDIAKIINGL